MKLTLILTALLMMVAAYGTPINASAEPHDSTVKIVTIKMQHYHFEPDKITIDAGTTVVWINTGKHTHTITDDHAAWDSGNLKPGEKFSHRFNEKGTFKYICVPHEEIGMIGTIIVK